MILSSVEDIEIWLLPIDVVFKNMSELTKQNREIVHRKVLT